MAKKEPILKVFNSKFIPLLRNNGLVFQSVLKLIEKPVALL